MKYLPLLVLGLLAAPAFADDVNVPVTPLPNDMMMATPVALSCLIQPDASLSDCRLADGAKASKADQDAAIAHATFNIRMAGAFTAGNRTRLTILVRKGGAPVLPIR